MNLRHKYRFVFIFLLVVFKSWAAITIQSPSSGQDIIIGQQMSFYFTYSSYSPNFKAEFYKGDTYIKTVEYLYNGATKPTSDLPQGNNYRIKIYGIYTPSDYAWSDYFNVIYIQPPVVNPPSSITSNQFNVTWNSVTNALSYRVDVSTDINFSNLIVNDVYQPNNATSYNVNSGLSPSTTYYARVRAYANGGYSFNSNVITITTLPVSPTASSASNLGSTYFTANWSSVQNATEYRLDVATDSGFSGILSNYNNVQINGTSTTITELTPNVTYYYRVRTVGISGNSLNSNTISTGTLLPPPLINQITVYTSSSFTVSWQSVFNALSYRLDVSSTSDFSTFVVNDMYLQNNITSYNVGSLSSASTYYVRVRTNNSYGVSENSTTASATTLPNAPIAVAATAQTDHSFLASWQGVSGASSYRIDVASDNSFNTLINDYNNVEVNGLSITINGLSAGTAYYYRVRAIGGSGNSSNSNTVSTGTVLPPPSSITSSSIGTQGFLITWSSVFNALSYRLDVSASNDFSNLIVNDMYFPGNMTSFNITSLSSASNYYFRVRTNGNYGLSPNSQTGVARTLPSAPIASNATEVTANSFKANWTSVDNGVTFLLDVATESGFNNLIASNIPVIDVFKIVNVPTPNINYYYRVRSSDGTNFSAYSTVSRVAHINVVLPAKDQIIPLGSNFILFYQSPQYVISGKAELYKGNNPIPVASFSGAYLGSQNSFSTVGLPAGDDYKIKVYDEINKVTEGWSEIFSINSNLANYTKEEEIRVPNVLDPTIIDGLPVGHKLQTYDFFDGLGKKIQTVSKQVSPTFLDFIQPYSYDALDRESKIFLPYTGGSNGWLKKDAIIDPQTTATNEQDQYRSGKQYAFYQLGGSLPIDQYPYAVSIYEDSPLKRTLFKGMPGEVWQPSQSSTYVNPAISDKSIKYSFDSNSAEEVILWKTVSSSEYPMGLIDADQNSTKYFGVNKLFKTKSKDENNRETIEYNDIDGNIVLKRVQAKDVVNTVDDENYASTYYVYDERSNVICIIPPQAVHQITFNSETYFSMSEAEKNNFLARWTYRYIFDAKNRVIIKQLPGADPIYYVYDDRDRLVMSQDGELRKSNKWTFTKYDYLNRPVITGIYVNESSLSAIQTLVNNYYSSLNSTKEWYESFSSDPGALTIMGYDNKSFPQLANSSPCTSITYYDNYLFKQSFTPLYDYVPSIISNITVNNYEYFQPQQAFSRVKGKATGVKTRNLSTGTWLNTVSYFNDQGRELQTISDNGVGGTDRVTYLHDFTGNVLSSTTTHTKSDVHWKDKMEVEEIGNTQLKKTIDNGNWGNSGAASVEMLSENSDGWVEFSISNIADYHMVGLSTSNSDASYSSINFALYQRYDKFQIYESGSYKGFDIPVSLGDVVRLERKNNQISYFLNGRKISDSQQSTNSALLLDVALGNPTGMIQNIRTSFANITQKQSRFYEFDHVGRVKKQWISISDANPVLLTDYTYNELGQIVDKKLHSNDGISFKQSIDYRYTIRGWLSKINNSNLQSTENLAQDNTNDGEDLFGMEVTYDKIQGQLNQPTYNGNPSSIKWSNHLSTGDVKEKAYNYNYDPLNRLIAGRYMEYSTSWDHSDKFNEDNIQYDLNGNITHLDRRGRGASIDVLSYDYGLGNQKSNRLLSVTDGQQSPLGFNDRNSIGEDFQYNANGDLEVDKNKKISSIHYNQINLPDRIVKSTGEYIENYYTATGRKLSQLVFNSDGKLQKKTDYAGGYIYEDNFLQFISHDEGRVLMTEKSVLYESRGTSLDGIVAVNGALLSLTNDDFGNYIKVIGHSSSSPVGVRKLAAITSVQEGSYYQVRVKGYQIGSTQPVLTISGNNGSVPLAVDVALADGQVNENWIEQVVQIPAGVNQIQADLFWESLSNDEEFFINDAEIIQIVYGNPEYQYTLRDPLGNSRVMFTTKDEQKLFTATLEDETSQTEINSFGNYSHVTNDLFDHTDSQNQYDKVHLLSGGYNSQIGMTKSLSVMPGDLIKAEVYAKYSSTTGNNVNLNGFAAALLSGFGLPNPTIGELGTASSALNNYGSLVASAGDHGEEGWPKGWLNIIVFNKNYEIVDLAFEQVDGDFVQEGLNKAPHQLLSREIKIKEPGFVYIYLSNEGHVQQDIYFDDLTITHTLSPVVQEMDYYPFGLTFNVSERDNAVPNKFGYNSKENVDDLGVNWLDFSTRMYMADIGRWGTQDLLSELIGRLSTYAYAYNNPVRFADPSGMKGVNVLTFEQDNTITDTDTELFRKGYMGADGKYYIEIYYASDNGNNMAFVPGNSPGPKRAERVTAQDGTRLNESLDRLKFKSDIMVRRAEEKAKNNVIVTLLKMAKLVDYADLAYKMGTDNFRKSYKFAGKLDGWGKAKGAAEIIVKIHEQDTWGTAAELAKLGISFTKIADGYAVAEIAYDALELLGESSLPEYYLQLKKGAAVDFVRAMNSPEGSEMRTDYLEKAISTEKESLKIRNHLLITR